MNVHQLAELTSKSASTIRRYKADLQRKGAYCGRPQWRVTTAQAQAVGLLEPDTATSHEQSPEQSMTSHEQSLEKELRARISTLEQALNGERERVKHLETILDTEKQEKLLWLQGYPSETRQLEQASTKQEPPQQETPAKQHRSFW